MADPVIIGIATFDGPGRRASLVETLTSLEKQADEIYVYMNDYADAAVQTFFPNVTCIFGPLSYTGDIGDVGKFYPFAKPMGPCYRLTCDDDLIYPPDYVETIIEGIERYDRKAVVSFHGKRFFAPADPWYKCKGGQRYACLGTVHEDAPITIPGSGASGWHSSVFEDSPLTLDDFPYNGIIMADIWFARAVNNRGIPRRVLAHEMGWIKHHEQIEANDTAWRINKRDAEKTAYITQVFNSVEWTL